MDIKQKLRHPQVQQQILEVAFPLLGYFLWDWSVLIIVVFYLLDYLASQIMFTRRLVFISKFQGNLNVKYIIISIISFLIIFGIINIALYQYFFSEDNYSANLTEILDFAKSEMWFLFPLILVSYYMMDKMLFFMPRRFTVELPKPYYIKNLVYNLVVLIVIVSGVIVMHYIHLQGVFIVLLIVLIKFCCDFFIKNKLLKINVV